MVISGYAKSDWKKALTLLRAMPGRGTAPTTVSYNAALSGCSRAKRWRLPYISPISPLYLPGCSRAKRWRLALLSLSLSLSLGLSLAFALALPELPTSPTPGGASRCSSSQRWSRARSYP